MAGISIAQDTSPTISVRSALYVRQSRDHTGDELGIQRQEAECRALAGRNEWPITQVFSDNDTSASGKVARPGYAKLLEAIRTGAVNALVIWHPDRLHRSPRELEAFIDLVERHGTQIATVSAGTYDLTTPAGRMVARIVGATARYEGEQKAARQRAQRIQAVSAGVMTRTSRRCFGYSVDGLQIDPSEAALIHEAARRIVAGDTQTSVVAWLNTQATTTTGGPWRITPLVGLLTNPRLAGYRIFEGKRFEGNWPAIFTQAQHEELVEALTPVRKLDKQRSSLLSGIVRCGRCGARLFRQRNRDYWYYTCLRDGTHLGCGRIAIRTDGTDEAVAAATIEALAVDPQVNERLRRLEEDYYIKGILTPERFEELAGPLRALAPSGALAELLGTTERTPEALNAKWEAQDLPWRRSIVQLVWAKVVVNPAQSRGRGSKAADRLAFESQ